MGFGLYLMVGLVPYIAISDGLTRSVTLFRANRTLIQRVRFPAEVLVLGELGGTLLHHGLALLVVAVVCAVAGVVSIAGAPWLVLGLALALLWMVGLSVLPDIGEILGLSLLVVFYGAPIVYPIELIGNQLLRTAISLNPLTQIVALNEEGDDKHYGKLGVGFYVLGNQPLVGRFLIFDALLGALAFVTVAGVILAPIFHRLLHAFHIEVND